MEIKGLNRKNEPIKVTIDGNTITNIELLDNAEGIDQYIIPGFIDIHTHGGYGTDFADCSEESTREYLRKLPIEGTTSIVHATITTEYDNLLKSIAVAKQVMDNPHEDEVRYLGVNIEGNFLNPVKKGAHKESLLEPITMKHVDDLSNTGAVKMISAAYELSTPEVVKYITDKGIIPSLAHSVATGEETNSFVESGLKGITHMFNAMPAFAHREDNSINRAMSDDRIWTELIVDGIHVNPEVVKLLYKIKPTDKMLIITDSAPAKGMPDGDYMFGELEIYKVGDTIKTKIDDSLAGSIANMHLCFTNFIKFTGCSIEEASIMTSTNQAKYLGLDNLGEIKEGFLADILLLDKETLEINKTISNGNVLYEKGEQNG